MRVALQDLIVDMAAMGAEALKSKKKTAETAEKARIDKSSEASILATMVARCSARGVR